MIYNKAYKVRDFESGEERRTPEGGELYAMAHVGEITKGPSDLDRSFWMVASNQTRDRDGDVIRAKGWNLKNFKKNPVGLWMHNYKELPVFRVPEIKVEGDSLRALMHFPEELGGLSDDVYRSFMAKTLKASSVGFGPEEIKDDAKTREEFGLPAEATWGNGILFWKQELWELSAVTVPSNPEALAQIKAMEGIDHLKEMLQHEEDFVIELEDKSDIEPGDELIVEPVEEPITFTVEEMIQRLEEEGYSVTPVVDEETLTVELDLSPEPDEGAYDELARSIHEKLGGEAFIAKVKDKARRAAKRVIDYEKGKLVEE